MTADSPFADGHAPDWAVAWGVDTYGAWADFALGEVVQRMRWIPPGEFVMGSPPTEAGRRDHEGPQHRVRLSEGFWLGDTPVTQALWSALTGEAPSLFKGEARPVEQVSWARCVAFCQRLSEAVPGEHAFRLPTEAEWEYACRAGSEGPPWAGAASEKELARVAWFDKNSGRQPHPVGEKPPNPWGLHDMLGNVWEWCSDAAFRRYTEEPQVEPVFDEASDRVYRGGAWRYSARYCRAASRDANRPSSEWRHLGFRLARGPQRPAPASTEPAALPSDRAAQASGAAGASEDGGRSGGRSRR